jgi:hypothetical protein
VERTANGARGAYAVDSQRAPVKEIQRVADVHGRVQRLPANEDERGIGTVDSAAAGVRESGSLDGEEGTHIGGAYRPPDPALDEDGVSGRSADQNPQNQAEPPTHGSLQGQDGAIGDYAKPTWERSSFERGLVRAAVPYPKGGWYFYKD